VRRELIKTIDGWRELLAGSVAQHNDIAPRDLDVAVHFILIRILFLRMCEDRGMGFHGQLASLQTGAGVYNRLIELFRTAGQLFHWGHLHFQRESGGSEPPAELAALAVDDRPLREIFEGLYDPENGDEYPLLPAEFLGQVYEQFLGKKNPQVRKAGGVYYTPTFIVDFVVKNTVEMLRAGRSPKEAGQATILDAACGGGAFLLGAYQFLLDRLRDRYIEDGPRKQAQELVRGRDGAWYLTSGEKKRILLQYIFGVDIDPQAVEVARLSLLLKFLEGESRNTMDFSQQWCIDGGLPDLSGNVRCGNSLIGPDFCYDRPRTAVDDERRKRINVFDWQAAFPTIMAGGGFDAVVGNPPWGQKVIENAADVKRYIRRRYPSTKGIYDMFRPFLERAIQLLRGGGALGMVLPDIVLLKDYEATRRCLLANLSLERIDVWGMAFASAAMDAVTVVATRSPAGPRQRVTATVHELETPFSQSIPQSDFWLNPRLTFNLFITPQKRQLLKKVQQHRPLGDVFEVHEGVHSGNIRSDLFVAENLDHTCRELYFGRGEIEPHLLRWQGKHIRLAAMPDGKTAGRYANAGKAEWHERQKILVRRTGDYVLAAVDRDRRYASNNFFLVFPKEACQLDLDGLCALLNSRFMTSYFRTIEPRRGKVFAELKIKHLAAFPLPSKGTLCAALNEAGMQRSKLAEERSQARFPADAVLARAAGLLDLRIDDLTREAYDLPAGSFDMSRLTS
jgi:SAM-dependent methyltransferase